MVETGGHEEERGVTVKKTAVRLSPIVRRYFDAWISRDASDFDHEQAFYWFVKAVAEYEKRYKCRPSSLALSDLIVEAWKRLGVFDNHSTAEADEQASLYETLLTYEKACRRFPDRLTEGSAAKDIVTYWLALGTRARSNTAYIEEKMREEYGEDWKEQKEKAMREYQRRCTGKQWKDCPPLCCPARPGCLLPYGRRHEHSLVDH
jgi:hypothetical protein